MTAKQLAMDAVEQLPADASIEDAMDRLFLLYKVERGIRQADRGNKVTQEEARQRMKHWLG